MNEPPIRLPASAYIMALISAAFVFFGGTFALGISAVMLLSSLRLPTWTGLFATPAVLLTAAVLACLSGWQTLQQARKKALWKSPQTEMQTTCSGCGESFSAQEPHCPVCGRKTAVSVAT